MNLICDIGVSVGVEVIGMILISGLLLFLMMNGLLE